MIWVSQSDRRAVKPRLYKDEVRSIFTRAAVVHVHPSPTSVAAGGYHVLEPGNVGWKYLWNEKYAKVWCQPGHLAVDTVAGASISKVRSARLRLTGHAHLLTCYSVTVLQCYMF